MTDDYAPTPEPNAAEHLTPLLAQGAHATTAASILRAHTTLGPRDLSAVYYPSDVTVRSTVGPPGEETMTLAAWLAAQRELGPHP